MLLSCCDTLDCSDQQLRAGRLCGISTHDGKYTDNTMQAMLTTRSGFQGAKLSQQLSGGCCRHGSPASPEAWPCGAAFSNSGSSTAAQRAPAFTMGDNNTCQHNLHANESKACQDTAQGNHQAHQCMCPQPQQGTTALTSAAFVRSHRHRQPGCAQPHHQHLQHLQHL
jgi:hypothetical protein